MHHDTASAHLYESWTDADLYRAIASPEHPEGAARDAEIAEYVAEIGYRIAGRAALLALEERVNRTYGIDASGVISPRGFAPSSASLTWPLPYHSHKGDHPMKEFLKAHYGKAVAFLSAWLLEAKLALSEYVNQLLAIIVN